MRREKMDRERSVRGRERKNIFCLVFRSPENAYAKLLDNELVQRRKLAGEEFLQVMAEFPGNDCALRTKCNDVTDLVFALLGHRCKLEYSPLTYLYT